ncbi:hypothetical protein OPV22_035181 [Ensete ventricosum]|uniref:Uncharacterized protein n=1 Tax=Ensete ventricosum TaxID=4639 RepID=A0AAX5K9E5_ENSVE|nr:hypothetical protein OPV22_035181 [Ensete ventricosum]
MPFGFFLFCRNGENQVFIAVTSEISLSVSSASFHSLLLLSPANQASRPGHRPPRPWSQPKLLFPVLFFFFALAGILRSVVAPPRCPCPLAPTSAAAPSPPRNHQSRRWLCRRTAEEGWRRLGGSGSSRMGWDTFAVSTSASSTLQRAWPLRWPVAGGRTSLWSSPAGSTSIGTRSSTRWQSVAFSARRSSCPSSRSTSSGVTDESSLMCSAWSSTSRAFSPTTLRCSAPERPGDQALSPKAPVQGCVPCIEVFSSNPRTGQQARHEEDKQTGCLPGLNPEHDEIVRAERKLKPELLTGTSNMAYHDRKACRAPLNAAEVTRLLKSLEAPTDARIYRLPGQRALNGIHVSDMDPGVTLPLRVPSHTWGYLAARNVLRAYLNGRYCGLRLVALAALHKLPVVAR